MSEAFRKLFAKTLPEPLAEREFWFCRIVSVPSLKRDQLALFLVNLAHHRRYQRPRQGERRFAQPIIHVDNLRGTKVADIRQVPWQQASTSLPAAGSCDDITALPECTKAQNRHPLGKADPGSSTCPSESPEHFS